MQVAERGKAHASGHLVPKGRLINVDATSSRRMDVNTMSFYVMCSLGHELVYFSVSVNSMWQINSFE